MTSLLIRQHAERVAAAFATQMYQRYQYDELSDWMADEYTLYGSMLSLGRLSPTQVATLIRDAYVDLEKDSVEGFMGPDLDTENNPLEFEVEEAEAETDAELEIEKFNNSGWV